MVKLSKLIKLTFFYENFKIFKNGNLKIMILINFAVGRLQRFSQDCPLQ